MKLDFQSTDIVQKWSIPIFVVVKNKITRDYQLQLKQTQFNSNLILFSLRPIDKPSLNNFLTKCPSKK